MTKLGASKLSLSTFSSEDLWNKTGRLEGSTSELFKLEDRKGGKYLLSPTHEEEITSLVGSIVQSYKELPLRLYQISRKYRDEPRPRQGLLRTREFLMKDLYTFDATSEEALKTYEIVRQAYTDFFNELNIPYLTAEASSGEIGGKLSHEYHIPTPKGEDKIISCDACDYVANEELADSRINSKIRELQSKGKDTSDIEVMDFIINASKVGYIEKANRTQHEDSELQAKLISNQWFGITKDRNTIVQAFLPTEVSTQTSNGNRNRKPEINPYMIKRVCPQLDLSVEDPMMAWKEHQEGLRASRKATAGEQKVIRAFDIRARLGENASNLPNLMRVRLTNNPGAEREHDYLEIPTSSDYPGQIDLVRIDTGDPCPRCSEGKLKLQTAVELGHTFHLGTRYSKPLDATITAAEPLQTSLQSNPNNKSQPATNSRQVPMQMGCHGIGVSRLIAAVADSLADAKGLNWPRVMAPIEVVIIPTKGQEEGAEEVYDILTKRKYSPFLEALDAIVDDRKKDFGWKLNDADLIGYPIIVVVGRDWKKGRECEVQCRRLGVKKNVQALDLRRDIETLFEQL